MMSLTAPRETSMDCTSFHNESSIKTPPALMRDAGGMLHCNTGVCVFQSRRSVDTIADNRKRSCLPD